MAETRWEHLGVTGDAVEYDSESDVVTLNLDCPLMKSLYQQAKEDVLAVFVAGNIAASISNETGEDFAMVFRRMVERCYLQPVSEGAAR